MTNKTVNSWSDHPPTWALKARRCDCQMASICAFSCRDGAVLGGSKGKFISDRSIRLVFSFFPGLTFRIILILFSLSAAAVAELRFRSFFLVFGRGILTGSRHAPEISRDWDSRYTDIFLHLLRISDRYTDIWIMYITALSEYHYVIHQSYTLSASYLPSNQRIPPFPHYSKAA